MSVQRLAASPGIVNNPEPIIVKKDISIDKLPEVSLSVGKEIDIFAYDATEKKVARVAWLIFSIIVFPVGIVRLIAKIINYVLTRTFLLPALKKDKAELNAKRAKLLEDPLYKHRCKRETIETADHVKLDTLFIHHPEQDKKPIKEQKYILFFNGNRRSYELELPQLMNISNETGVNIYTGNYRGVGCSESSPTGYQDLVIDGEAMVQNLLRKGVQQENILIHGWSFGGGVGAHVAVLHQGDNKNENHMHIAVDRTFASMADVVRERFRILSRIKDKKTLKAKFEAIGFTLITPFTVGLVYALGWNFKSLECFNKVKGHKFMIYHPEDPIIPYPSSVYMKLKDTTIKMTQWRKEWREKLERKKKKITMGELYVREDFERAYRPKNAIKLTNEKENSHNAFIDQLPQFEEYKKQVAFAFKM